MKPARKSWRWGGNPRGSVVGVLIVALSLAVPFVSFSPLSAQGTIVGVGAIGMTVSDMERSIDFYSRVLSFQTVSDTEVFGEAYEHLEGVFGLRMRVVEMRLGTEAIELTEYLVPKGKPYPADTRSNDRWFQHIAIAVRNMDKAYELLRKHKVQYASTGPQRIPDWNTGAAGIRAFYFRDPDGHFLELIFFPAGKGDPKWQASGEKIFLGIDHTAIVVKETDSSLRFYRDLLGLRVAGESENYGTEQEHLNNVFGARLRISGLRAASGPGIEFLEYLTPRNGRPSPGELSPNDIAHWQTTLVTRDIRALLETVRAAKASLISPGVVRTDGALGFSSGLLVQDPDGHAMRVVERTAGAGR